MIVTTPDHKTDPNNVQVDTIQYQQSYNAMVREGKSRGMTIVRGHDTAAHTDTNSRQKRRNYVDFGTTRGSEAAVEKWLSETDVPTTRRPPTSTDPPRVRSQSVSGRFTSSNPSLLKRMSSYKRGSSSGPMFRETDSSRSALFSRGDATSYEKGHLKEKFRSKLNLMRSPSASKSQSISSHRKRESFEPPGEKSDEQRTDDGCTPSRPGQDERSSTDPCVSTLSCLSINAQNSVDIASMVVQHDEVKNASSPVPGSVRSNTDTSTLKQCTKNGETTPSPAVDEEYRIDTQSSVFMEKEAARSLGPLFHSDRDSQSERDSPPASVAATSNVSLKSKRAVDDCLSTSSPPLKDTYDLITKALAEPINDTSSKPVEDLSSPAAPVNDPIGTPVVAPASATASTPSSASTAASTKSFPKEKLHGPFISNRIKLHIYDLISSDTTYELPLGVTLPIGTYFSVLNDGLHRIGSGAYHVGVEVRTYILCICINTSGMMKMPAALSKSILGILILQFFSIIRLMGLSMLTVQTPSRGRLESSR